MNLIDKKYLTLQFRNRIYEKNGTEFQSFFENIMEKVFHDYQKIQPYGKEGDSGNDGYIKSFGVYYQVYAPNEPRVSKAHAASKLKIDFQKLKAIWDEISEIKEYYFVFNDKYTGSAKNIEAAIAELERENPNIKFDIFLAKNLQEVFFTLNEADISDLGFDVDLTKAVKNAYEYLAKVEIELDRENAEFAHRILESIKDIINDLDSENLKLEYDILECRCLQKLESINEAKSKYDNIISRYPEDPRALLYKAEICLGNNDFDENEQLLQRAQQIDANHWLLKFEKLLRIYYLKESINLTNIDEKQFSDDLKIKSGFYRLYAHFLSEVGNTIMADSFIERAINLNPDKLNNYITKLSIIERKIYLGQDHPTPDKSALLLKEIDVIEGKITIFGGTGPRNRVVLNMKKLNIFRLNEDYDSFITLTKETIDLIHVCYLNNQIDQILVGLLSFVLLPDDDYEQLLNYIEKSQYGISEDLIKIIILQFNGSNNRVNIGKAFFARTNKQKYVDFINYLETKNYDNTLKFLRNDHEFAISIAGALTSFPELRKKIADSLTEKFLKQKEKIFLSIFIDENNLEEAFKIIQRMDLSELSYLECKQILDVVLKKQAWDYSIVILDKLIKHEKDKRISLRLNLYLFNALFHLGNYPGVIKIGGGLLEHEFNGADLDLKHKEMLLAQTITAYMMRSEFVLAKQLFDKYPLRDSSFDFKVRIEAEIYIRNNDPQKAFISLIEGVKIKKVLAAAEYATLYPLVVIKIGNLLKFDMVTLNIIKENSFVKLKSKTKWYFIGNDNELDALKISKETELYSLFINKKITDKIIIENTYAMQKIDDSIEFIYSIEQYIFWKIQQNFHELSEENIIDGVQVIAVPKKEGIIDTKNLLSFLENLHEKRKPFIEMYKNNPMPFAMLAAYEGGLLKAIGCVLDENAGYINFSTGVEDELNKQKRNAENVVNNKLPFYIDGTSAFILSEMKYFSKIGNYIPNLKVPQSVINLLNKIVLDLQNIPGRVGYMKYAQGGISFLSIEKSKSDLIKSNLSKSIKYLESRSDNIITLSDANKADCFSEKKIPPELCDACILAQKEGIYMLTEDFRYLQMNELQTSKKAPEYFSSLILLRILYEQKKIDFEDYLDFFGYLSSYRFRFMQLSTDDVIKAVFGDTSIKTVKPENIRKFNFPLTLSEEYGVSFQAALSVIVQFLLYILTNDIILPEHIDKLFIEIIESFPSQMDKNDLGQILHNICVLAIEENKSKFIIFPKNKITKEKLERLKKIINIYQFKRRLWIPNN